jgi:hypothetical protein
MTRAGGACRQEAVLDEIMMDALCLFFPEFARRVQAEPRRRPGPTVG